MILKENKFWDRWFGKLGLGTQTSTVYSQDLGPLLQGSRPYWLSFLCIHHIWSDGNKKVFRQQSIRFTFSYLKQLLKGTNKLLTHSLPAEVSMAKSWNIYKVYKLYTELKVDVVKYHSTVATDSPIHTPPSAPSEQNQKDAWRNQICLGRTPRKATAQEGSQNTRHFTADYSASNYIPINAQWVQFWLPQAYSFQVLPESIGTKCSEMLSLFKGALGWNSCWAWFGLQGGHRYKERRWLRKKQIAPKIIQNMEVRDQMCFDLVALVYLHVAWLSMLCLRCFLSFWQLPNPHKQYIIVLMFTRRISLLYDFIFCCWCFALEYDFWNIRCSNCRDTVLCRLRLRPLANDISACRWDGSKNLQLYLSKWNGWKCMCAQWLTRQIRCKNGQKPDCKFRSVNKHVFCRTCEETGSQVLKQESFRIARNRPASFQIANNITTKLQCLHFVNTHRRKKSPSAPRMW